LWPPRSLGYGKAARFAVKTLVTLAELAESFGGRTIAIAYAATMPGLVMPGAPMRLPIVIVTDKSGPMPDVDDDCPVKPIEVAPISEA